MKGCPHPAPLLPELLPVPSHVPPARPRGSAPLIQRSGSEPGAPPTPPAEAAPTGRAGGGTRGARTRGDAGGDVGHAGHGAWEEMGNTWRHGELGGGEVGGGGGHGKGQGHYEETQGVTKGTMESPHSWVPDILGPPCTFWCQSTHRRWLGLGARPLLGHLPLLPGLGCSKSSGHKLCSPSAPPGPGLPNTCP